MSLSYRQFENSLYQRAISCGIPLAGEFELTARCNFSCKMCYIGRNTNDEKKKAREYTTSDWLKLAEDARNSGMLNLTLTGGEVLMRNDFMEIYVQIAKMGFVTTLFTNASMVTAEVARKLGQMPPSLIEITLYGASPDTYGKVCGNPEGYSKTVRGIELLLAEGLRLNLKTTIIPDNIEDYDMLFEFADKHGIGLKHIKYISPLRDECGGMKPGTRLSPEEQVKINTYASNRYARRLKDIVSTLDIDTPAIFDKHKEIFRDHNSNAFKCASGRCSFWMTWDGRMTPCGLIDRPAFRPFEIGFTEAWNKLRESCTSVPSCKECNECSIKDYCFTCPARLKNETGYFDRPAAYLCEMAKRLKDFN